MSIIHNRTSVVLCAVAAAVLLLGAGCSKRGYQLNSGALDQGTSTLPPADAATPPAVDVDSGLPTKWVEYRSDKLGITIPYPEGWYVEEKTEEETDGRSVDFYESEPPASSDAPSALWLQQRTSDKVELVIQEEFPTVRSREQITRSGIVMTRITYPYDERLAPDVSMSAYIWRDRGEVVMVGGPEGGAVLEYAVDHVGVLP